MQTYCCNFVLDGRIRVRENLHAATLNEAMVACRIRLADQQESERFSGVEIWEKARTPVDENAEPIVNIISVIEDLRQSIRARDDFVAIAAHELRNAMMPIGGVVDLTLIAARDTGSICSPRLMALLERLQCLVDDFLRRAAKLLDVSRVETGNVRLDKSLVNLSSLVRLTAHRYETMAARKGSSIVLEIEDDISDLWDPLAVEQVLENILSNAIKFGMGRPITVRLRSSEHSAWLEVWDRGMGMRPEQSAGIFGRFEQAVTQHRGSGFGIGLWVANRLVVAMNGQFIVETRLGEGSNFAVELPRTRWRSGRDDTKIIVTAQVAGR
jgi:two-component system OmpR family sensor kinase